MTYLFTVLFPFKKVNYWEEKVCKQIQIDYLLTVLLLIPHNKLPGYQSQSHNIRVDWSQTFFTHLEFWNCFEQRRQSHQRCVFLDFDLKIMVVLTLSVILPGPSVPKWFLCWSFEPTSSQTTHFIVTDSKYLYRAHRFVLGLFIIHSWPS